MPIIRQLKYDPNDSEAYNNKAMVLEKLGEN